MRIFAFGLLLFACGGALAAGYDDFSQGVSAATRDDFDLVITFMTRALDEGGLTPHMQMLAHYDRGEAYLHKDRCRDAVDELTAALALDAKYARARRLRSAANLCLGNTDAALADATQSLADLPGATGHVARGQLYWNLGRFAEAADDFRDAMKTEPSNPFVLLWMKISAARAKTDDAGEFARAAKKATDDWPRPLLDFYMNAATRDAVTKAAMEGTDAERLAQQCEANFYLAEWDLAQGQTDDAKPLLRQASDNCPKNSVEYSAANTELVRLK